MGLRMALVRKPGRELVQAAERLRDELGRLARKKGSGDAKHVLSPLEYAWENHKAYLEKHARKGVAAIFVWSVYLGAYHAGVEWKFWAGPSACTSQGGALDLSQLSNLNAVKSVPCDVVQWRDPVLKLSLAAYNALLSLVIVALLLVALVGGLRQGRRTTVAA